MGCSYSLLRSLLPVRLPLAMAGERAVSFNGRRFHVLRTLGQGGYAFVYLVQELEPLGVDDTATRLVRPGGRAHEYALKQILAQTPEQLETARAEIAMNRRVDHAHVLPLLDSAVVALGGDERPTDADKAHHVFLLFPAYKDGTLQDALSQPPADRRRFTPREVLAIFDQVAAAVEALHTLDPPYAHWDIKPGNVLIACDGKDPREASSLGDDGSALLMSYREERDRGLGSRERGGMGRTSKTPFVVLNDLGSARKARITVNGRKDAMALMEAAELYASAPYRAPELWDLPSHAHLDERVDVWAMGCLLYALMYRESPFEWQMTQAGGSLALAVMSGNIRWPNPSSGLSYPDTLHHLVTFMLQSDPAERPTMTSVRARVKTALADPSLRDSDGEIMITVDGGSSNHQVPFRDTNGVAWEPFAKESSSATSV